MAENPIFQWKINFLRVRGHTRSTGMPLYTYKVSAQEFNELESLLRQKLQAYLQLYSLGAITQTVPLFPALFVIYAAEWWRRRYDGTGWAWEPITQSLGVSVASWTLSQRSACVEKGLQDWGIGLRDTHGLRYLGSIAFNGGLPIRLLSEARGRVGAVLSRVLRLAATGASATDVQGWVSSLENMLPATYRQQEIYVLLTETVLSILDLRRQVQPDAGPIIEQLERVNPNWRDRFPFPIEDAEAKQLLDRLVNEAAAVPASSYGAHRIYLQRRLENSLSGEWHLQAEVFFPEYMTEQELKKQFNTENTEYPRTLQLCVVREAVAAEISLRRLAGQPKYRAERQPVTSLNASAVVGHTLSLNAPDGRSWFADLPKGGALDADLPWIFEATEGNTDSLYFVRQGSGAIPLRSWWCCVPVSWQLSTESGGKALASGQLPSLGRVLFQLAENAVFTDQNGETYSIRSGQANAQNDQFEWSGTRAWNVFPSDQAVFRGVPTLYGVSEDGLRQPVAGQLGWRIAGGAMLPRPGQIWGPQEAVLKLGGHTRWRSQLILLPNGSEERFEGGVDSSKGRIFLLNWGVASALSLTDGVEVRVGREGGGTQLEVIWSKAGAPPEWLDVELAWTSNPWPAKAKFPFPVRGARAFDAAGRLLRNRETLSIDQLAGVRLIGFLGTQHRAMLELMANYGDAAARFPITREIRSEVGASRVEVRVIDYLGEIERLLAMSDDLDASVMVSLRAPGGGQTSLEIHRYAAAIHRESDDQVAINQAMLARISMESLQSIHLNALRLDRAGDEPVDLEQRRSEGVVNGCWDVRAGQFSPGPWLIYPRAESALKIRPLLWPEQGDFEAEGELNCALTVSSQQDRIDAIDKVIAELAGDYLHQDWAVVERLARHLGHLPLSTLDIWKRFAHSHRGMAALAFRVGSLPQGLLARFVFELPFLWEFIPFTSWKESIVLARKQCSDWYGDNGDTVFKSHVQRGIQEITSRQHSMRVMLAAACDSACDNISMDVAFARVRENDTFFSDLLFHQEHGLLQRMLRNNAEAQWPQGFQSSVNAARGRRDVGSLLCRNAFEFRDSVINVPLMLAVQSVLADGDAALIGVDRMSSIRVCQAFDPDWFADAFDLTVARCLATGLLEI